MTNWLRFLLAFLVLALPDDTASGGADGGDAGAGDAGDAGDGGDAGEGDAGEGTDGEAGAAEEEEHRRRAGPSQADRQLAEENARLRQEMERLRQPAPRQGQSEDEKVFEAEEQKLRDPKTTALEKWQIESNRSIRATNRNATTALQQAQDMADRTSFDLACRDNKRLAAVRNEVEEELKRLRATGQGAPREALAYFLLGKKVATAPAQKPKQQQQQQQQQDQRQRGAAPKSDVRKGAQATEHDKRRQRLENQII